MHIAPSTIFLKSESTLCRKLPDSGAIWCEPQAVDSASVDGKLLTGCS